MVMVWHDQGQWSDVPCNYHLSYTCKMGLGEASRRSGGGESMESGLCPRHGQDITWTTQNPWPFAIPLLPSKILGAVVTVPGSQFLTVSPAVSCGPPPELPLAQVFGSPRLRYEVDTVLRYRCRKGLVQRNLPLIRCREDGSWESPRISCVPRRTVSARRGLCWHWRCGPGMIRAPLGERGGGGWVAARESCPGLVSENMQPHPSS